MSEHLKLGSQGEDWACEYLRGQGYEIACRNYRYGRAEIDIVARKEKLLVFVEVKTRTNLSHGEPEAAVTGSKVGRLRKAAEHYIYATDWVHDVRFDVIAISLDGERHLEHIQDAFW
jgi:putative endonuclease